MGFWGPKQLPEQSPRPSPEPCLSGGHLGALRDVLGELRDALGVLTESSEELLEILRLEWMWIPQCGVWAGIEVVVLVVVA